MFIWNLLGKRGTVWDLWSTHGKSVNTIHMVLLRDAVSERHPMQMPQGARQWVRCTGATFSGRRLLRPILRCVSLAKNTLKSFFHFGQSQKGTKNNLFITDKRAL